MYFYKCNIIDISKIEKTFDNVYLLTKGNKAILNLMNSITHIEEVYKTLTNVDIVACIYYSYNEKDKYMDLLIGSNKPIDVVKYKFLYRITNIDIEIQTYNHKKYIDNNRLLSIKKEYDSFINNKDDIITDLSNIDIEKCKNISIYYDKNNKLIVKITYKVKE